MITRWLYVMIPTVIGIIAGSVSASGHVQIGCFIGLAGGIAAAAVGIIWWAELKGDTE